MQMKNTQVMNRRNWLVACVAAVMLGCGGGIAPEGDGTGDGNGSASAGDGGKLKVTATVNMVGDLVRQVGGEHVEVTELMGPGVDPHLYQATQADLSKLRKADVILYVGMHLEGKIQDTLEKMNGQGRKHSVSVTKDIDKTTLLKDPEAEEYPDPHIWFEVPLWAQTVDVVVETLSKADPANKADYEKNGDATKDKMTELQTWVADTIKDLPEEKRILVTSHDAYSYFGRAYGFKVVGLQGISTVSEAGLADRTKLVDFIKEQKVKAIFVETSVSPEAIKAIASDAGVVIGGELFSDAMGKLGQIKHGNDVGTYEGMIKHNVSTIVNALK